MGLSAGSLCDGSPVTVVFLTLANGSLSRTLDAVVRAESEERLDDSSPEVLAEDMTTELGSEVTVGLVERKDVKGGAAEVAVLVGVVPLATCTIRSCSFLAACTKQWQEESTM